jgi:hypothetical protein
MKASYLKHPYFQDPYVLSDWKPYLYGWKISIDRLVNMNNRKPHVKSKYSEHKK